METTKISVSLRIDKKLKEKLDKMAKKEVRDLASLMRRILTEAAEKTK